MTRNTVLWVCGLIVTVAVLVVGFGYLDEDLGEVRRWIGCGMIVGALALVVPAARHLAEDWPRAKPQHNIDVAFARIFIGIVVLFLASTLGGRSEKFFAPLLHPAAVPQMAPPDGQMPPEPSVKPPPGAKR